MAPPSLVRVVAMEVIAPGNGGISSRYCVAATFMHASSFHNMAAVGVEVTVVQKAHVETCSHHWIIQTTECLLTIGVCYFCSEEREFLNDEVWDFGKLRLQSVDSFDFN